MKKLFILVFLLWGSFSFANSGENYYNKGMDSYHNGNYSKAKELFEKSCDMGSAGGCNNLGDLYAKGQGVRQSYIKAKELFEKSCDMGCANGCNNLGFLYAKGQGVRQSYIKAKELFGKSCDMGNAAGCKNYAVLNEHGY